MSRRLDSQSCKAFINYTIHSAATIVCALGTKNKSLQMFAQQLQFSHLFDFCLSVTAGRKCLKLFIIFAVAMKLSKNTKPHHSMRDFN